MIIQGNKYQLMTKSHLQDGTEPVVFVSEVAKHEMLSEYLCVLALVSDWIKRF